MMLWSPHIFVSLSKKAPAVDHCFVKTQKLPIKIVSTKSLVGDGYLLKVGFFSFGSPVSDYAISKPIFDNKATEDKTNISTPMLSVSGRNSLPFGSMASSA